MSEIENWYKKLANKFWDKYEKLDADVNSEQIIKEVKPQKAKAFVGIIFRELGKLLDEQIYVKNNGELVVPPKIMIFLSGRDDKEWQGAKREALTEDLQNICLEKLKEKAGKPSLSIKPIYIELKVDGTLEEEKVRVEYLWEDDRNKTPPISEAVKVDQRTIKDNEEEGQEEENPSSIEAREKTIPYSEISNQIFYVEIWRNEKKEKELTFYQNQITIGRNSETKGKVDINLDDPRVAREHATLEMDSNKICWITANSDNPTKVGDFTVPKNKTVQVGNNQTIQIIDFTLKLRQ